MPNHPRSDYGVNPHGNRSRNNADQRGWGAGWPSCPARSSLVRVRKAGVMVPVRREIGELVAVLLEASETRHGYDIRDGQTWGFACRPIRGTQVASNHSWGLAVDINSLANPMQSTFKSDMPPSMVAMWEACGFFWGGRYTQRPDAMHYEYIFRPSDVPAHLARARTYLGGAPIASPIAPPPPPPARPSPAGFESYRVGVQPGSRSIKRGAAGDDVKELQLILERLYPSVPPHLVADGFFGPKTDARVRHAQQDKRIVVDGIVGPITWGAIGVR